MPTVQPAPGKKFVTGVIPEGHQYAGDYLTGHLTNYGSTNPLAYHGQVYVLDRAKQFLPLVLWGSATGDANGFAINVDLVEANNQTLPATGTFSASLQNGALIISYELHYGDQNVSDSFTMTEGVLV